MLTTECIDDLVGSKPDMHDLALVREIQAEVGLVPVPQAKKFPRVVFIPALLRPENLYVTTCRGRDVKLDAGIDASDEKFIGRELGHQGTSTMIFGAGRLGSTIELGKSKGNRRLPFTEIN